MTMQHRQRQRIVIHPAFQKIEQSFQKIEQSLAPIISVLSSSSSHRSKPTGEPTVLCGARRRPWYQANTSREMVGITPTFPALQAVKTNAASASALSASRSNPAPNPYLLRFTQNPLNGSSPRHRDSFPRAMLRSSPIGPPNPQ